MSMAMAAGVSLLTLDEFHIYSTGSSQLPLRKGYFAGVTTVPWQAMWHISQKTACYVE
jgi:hypothetical protein